MTRKGKGGKGMETEGDGRGREGRGEKGWRREGQGEGLPPLYLTSGYGPAL